MRIVIAFVAVLLFQTIAVDSVEAGPFCGAFRAVARRAAHPFGGHVAARRHGACAGTMVVTQSACATANVQAPTQAPAKYPPLETPNYTAP